MDWKEDYQRKLCSPEQAASLIKSRDYVVFSRGREAQSLGLALAARKADLKGVRVYIPTPGRDFGWYDPGWQDSFDISVSFVNPIARRAMDQRRIDYMVPSGAPQMEEFAEGASIDVFLVEVSPPDERGFCSFGSSVWDKRERLTIARKVIGEVNPRLIRTFGDNFIHVSEMHHIVEQPAPPERRRSSRGASPDPHVRPICEQVASLIRDGDTIQIGAGSTTEWLPETGVLDSKADLGWHSEMTPRGIVRLVRAGVINSRRKSVGRGKMVSTAAGGAREDMESIDGNPLFELRSMYYTHNIGVISAHENMVAINNAISIDLTGQITAESIGPVMWSGPGGQTSFHIGAATAKGGRAITVLPSTANTPQGKVSRIVAQHPPGTVVTVPRTFADIVVTEHGIARLRGSTQRQRADALIAVAHPDFRGELRKEAQRLFWSG